MTYCQTAGSSDASQAAALWTPQQGELLLPNAADVIMPQISASAGSAVAAGAPGVAVERGSGYDEHRVRPYMTAFSATCFQHHQFSQPGGMVQCQRCQQQQHVQLSCPAGCMSAHDELQPIQSWRCAQSVAVQNAQEAEH